MQLPCWHRNTATNETAWEIPSTTTPPSSTTSTVPQQQEQHPEQQQQAEAVLSNDALFDILAEAYTADGSGMQFWEVARAHRSYGLFDPPFFEYLEQRQKAAAGGDGDAAEQREMAFKMMCRLANPLLRQPAPFE